MVLQRSPLHHFHDNVQATLIGKAGVVVDDIGVPQLPFDNFDLSVERDVDIQKRVKGVSGSERVGPKTGEQGKPKPTSFSKICCARVGSRSCCSIRIGLSRGISLMANISWSEEGGIQK